MKIRWKILIPSLLLPLAVGGLSALLSGDGMRQFDLLNKPLLSPPGWLFPVALLPIAMKKHRLLEPSMLQDLKKGKPCEIDAINGVVCEWGRKCGVPTPINDRIVEIIKKEQSGELPLKKENIRLFDDLVR